MILMAVFYIMLITVNFRFQFARCYRFSPYLRIYCWLSVFFSPSICRCLFVVRYINLSNDSAIICLLGTHLFHGKFNALIYGPALKFA